MSELFLLMGGKFSRRKTEKGTVRRQAKKRVVKAGLSFWMIWNFIAPKIFLNLFKIQNNA